MVSLERAIEILWDNSPRLPDETVDLFAAHGRILAQEVSAERDLPTCRRSRLDGYGITSEDLARSNAKEGVSLRVVGELSAGSRGNPDVPRGATVRLSTGSPLPEGIEAVVPVERVLKGDEGDIRILGGVKPGDNVSYPGEYVRENEKLVHSGSRIEAPEIAVMAALGIRAVRVFRRPWVAVLVTGSELVDVSWDGTSAEHRNVNGPAIAARIAELGAIPLTSSVIPDDSREITKAVEEHLACDVVILTGGTSLGQFDLTGEALEGVGATPLFSRISMRPGGSCRAAIKGSTLIICLPGNPTAALAVLDVVVGPVLLKMAGLASYDRAFLVRATDPLPQRPEVTRCIRGFIWGEEGNLYGKPYSSADSVLKSMTQCNGYLLVPAGSGQVRRGGLVKAVLSGEIALARTG